jgi:hypothetical protein
MAKVRTVQVHEDKVAASATCQNKACEKVALKIINFSSYTQVRCPGCVC